MTLIHEEISYKILGALFEVYNEVGSGHKETVYQRSLAESLKNKGLVFQEQVKVVIRFQGTQVGFHLLDFLVADEVIVELKARNNFRAADYKQAKSYLQSLNKQLAILATFTPGGVRYRRILNLY